MTEELEVARLRAVLEARADQFRAGMTEATTALGQLEQATTRVDTTLQTLTAHASRVGLALTAGVTVPVALMSRAAVTAASDLAESVNKTRVVFEDAAGAVERWAAQSVDAVGLSRQAAMEGASSFGALLKAQGLTGEAAAELSIRLVQLAADARSLHNLESVEVALDKFRSALVGQFMPLRQLGIVLSQEAIASEALRLGLIRAGEAVTDYARIVATASLIEQQASVFSGDFARTKDELANSLVRLRAELRDAQAALGQQFLPAVLEGTRSVIAMVRAISQLPPGAVEAATKLALLAAAVGPLLLVTSKLHGAYTALTAAQVALAAKSEMLGVALKTVLSPGFAAAAAAAGTLTALLVGINREVTALVSTAGTAEAELAKVMAKNEEMFELHATYLTRLLAAHQLSGERWQFSREMTEANAREILRLIAAVKDYQRERQAVSDSERSARQAEMAALTQTLMRRATENRALREKYEIMTRGESQQALRAMEAELETLAKSGVAVQELARKFLPDLSAAVKRHAESYGEAEIPRKIAEIAKAWEETQAGQPARLQAMLAEMSGAVAQAVEESTGQVMEWGVRIGRKLSGGFGMAVEEGISYGEQALRKWAAEVEEKMPLRLRVELDTAAAEGQLGRLGGML